MNLKDLIKYFRKGGNLKDFYLSNELNPHSEIIGVYMSKPFNFEKPIYFFELEKTEGLFEYETGGIKYFNLFDIHYFLDFIEESNNDLNKQKTNIDLAKILFNYSINDA